MQKNPGSILYFLLHAVIFAALFLPPIWIPNHRNASGEYHLALAMILFPLGTAVAGGIAAVFPQVRWQVRAASGLAAAILAFHGLYFAGFNAFFGILAYAAVYLAAFFLVRLVIRIVRSVRADYSGYLARHRDGK